MLLSPCGELGDVVSSIFEANLIATIFQIGLVDVGNIQVSCSIVSLGLSKAYQALKYFINFLLELNQLLLKSRCYQLDGKLYRDQEKSMVGSTPSGIIQLSDWGPGPVED